MMNYDGSYAKMLKYIRNRVLNIITNSLYVQLEYLFTFG